MAAIVFLVFDFYPKKSGFPASQNSTSQSPLEKPALTGQTNSEGSVTVAVTPRDLSEESKIWTFEIVLDTHSVELNYNLSELSEIIDEKGNVYKPFSWQGASGGHHVSGILTFEATNPPPSSIVLFVREVGGVSERKFKWEL